MRLLCWTILFLACPSAALAGPIGIQLFTQSYATNVRWSSWAIQQTGFFAGSDDRTLAGGLPLSDEFDVTVNGAPLIAEATASAFDVMANGDAALFGTSANGFANSMIEFSPFTTGIGTLMMDVLSGNQVYTQALLELTDLTTNEQVWRIGWTTFSEFIVFRDAHHHNGTSESPFPVPMSDVLFDSTHRYRLSLMANANGSGDSQRVTMGVKGLIVPEPATIALVALGWSAVAFRRRRSRTHL